MSAFEILLLVALGLFLALGAATFLAVRFGLRYRYERDRDRCAHQWYRVGASYSRLKGKVTATGFVSVSEVNRLKFGVTTLTQRCARCHLIRTTTHTGQVELPGLTWEDVA